MEEYICSVWRWEGPQQTPVFFCLFTSAPIEVTSRVPCSSPRNIGLWEYLHTTVPGPYPRFADKEMKRWRDDFCRYLKHKALDAEKAHAVLSHFYIILEKPHFYIMRGTKTVTPGGEEGIERQKGVFCRKCAYGRLNARFLLLYHSRVELPVTEARRQGLSTAGTVATAGSALLALPGVMRKCPVPLSLPWSILAHVKALSSPWKTLNQPYLIFLFVCLKSLVEIWKVIIGVELQLRTRPGQGSVSNQLCLLEPDEETEAGTSKKNVFEKEMVTMLRNNKWGSSGAGAGQRWKY